MVALMVLASMFTAPGEQVVTGIEDSAITAQIETLFLLNEHLNPFNINTTTQDGNVMISGSVGDETQKKLAEDLARSVKGVAFVDNRLVVIETVIGDKEKRTWKQRVADRATSASVKGRLLLNGEFKGLKIGVSTINGVVNLYGVVPTEEHALTMARIAEETKGVLEVENNLTVRRKDDAYDAVRGVGRQISDEWLESRVETAVLLNSHISIRELDIEVDDGIVIMTGSVNSEEKKELAGEIANAIRGVNEVRNNIIVREGGEVVEKEMDELPSVTESEAEDLPAPTKRPTLEGSEPLEDDFLSGSTPQVEETALTDS